MVGRQCSVRSRVATQQPRSLTHRKHLGHPQKQSREGKRPKFVRAAASDRPNLGRSRGDNDESPDRVCASASESLSRSERRAHSSKLNMTSSLPTHPNYLLRKLHSFAF